MGWGIGGTRHGRRVRQAPPPVCCKALQPVQDGLRFRDATGDPSQAASITDGFDESELLLRGAAFVFDLDGNEHGELGANHVRRDGDAAPADEV